MLGALNAVMSISLSGSLNASPQHNDRPRTYQGKSWLQNRDAAGRYKRSRVAAIYLKRLDAESSLFCFNVLIVDASERIAMNLSLRS